MTDTVVTDAALAYHDEGLPNIADGAEDWNSAGLRAVGLKGAHGKFLHGWTGFSGHNGTADTVDVDAFVAVFDLDEAGVSVDVQSGLGGSSAPAYDTTLAAAGVLPAAVPAQTGLSMTASTLNPVWVAYATDNTVTTPSPGDVYLRHGSGESEPPAAHPSIKLGETNPDDATADFRAGYDNPPDGDGWREDPNSPLQQTVTGSQVDYDLVGRYDEVRVDMSFWTDRAQDAGFDVRVNNVSTANYNTWRDGSEAFTGQTEFGPSFAQLQASGQDVDGTIHGHSSFILSGRWTSGDPECSLSLINKTVNGQGGGIDPFSSGACTAPGGVALDQINFVPTNNTGFDIRVYGRNGSSRPNTG